MNLGEESVLIEFKEGLAQLDKGLKSLTAMLNRQGRGTVYFGVKDNGDVCGMIVGNKTIDKIHQRASDLIRPRIVLDLQVLVGDDRQYISVSAKGSDAPYSCDGRFYIRNVRSDDALDNDSLRRILVEGKTDVIKEAESDVQELSFGQLCTYLAATGMHAQDTPGFQKSKGLFTKEGKYNMMAYLLSDQCDVSIKVVEFSGTDKTAMAKRTEYGHRCLLLAVDEVQRYIRSINATKTELTNGTRIDTPLFSYDAFHEAWINACVHNEWFAMVPPSVFVFDDRIEVVSYGPLPLRLSKKEFYSGTSMPVNKGLFSIFTSANLAEESGHGIPEIVKECGKKSISIGGVGVKVTIPFQYESDRSQISKKKARERLSKTNIRILSSMEADPFATLPVVAENTGIKLPTIKKAVLYLQEIGALRRIGSKKTGRWEVIL